IACSVRLISFRHIAESDSVEYLICGLPSNFGDFTQAKFSACNSRGAGSQGSETVSLPYGTSAFDRQEYIRRVNRMLIEGPSPSIRIRSRFPLHPSLPALDGVSIEEKR